MKKRNIFIVAFIFIILILLTGYYFIFFSKNHTVKTFLWHRCLQAKSASQCDAKIACAWEKICTTQVDCGFDVGHTDFSKLCVPSGEKDFYDYSRYAK